MKRNSHFTSKGIENASHSAMGFLKENTYLSLQCRVMNFYHIWRFLNRLLLKSLLWNVSEPTLHKLYYNFLYWVGCRFAPLFVKKAKVLVRGGSRGRVQGVRSPPPPPQMTCGFLIQLVFCKKRTICGLLVLVTPFLNGAPLPKKISWIRPLRVEITWCWRKCPRANHA